MYLLHTTDLTLHRFDGTVPPYAILSHRWDAEEVLFQDLQAGRGPNMPGYAKIQGCCVQAVKDGWTWAWIDSCCIDKSSSAELSEAINSMFKWYAEAIICYVYLKDVEAGEHTSTESRREAFRTSQWFTRGWTLQELLAPRTIVFFDQKWEELGTKSSLKGLITIITGIQNLDSWKNACVAQKMSWASNRETTRTEDMAYCLMGLFGVHMPLLYGEGGERAFIRLQLEIMKNSTDESIFAWYSEFERWERKSFSGKGMLAPSWTGMLARSPMFFQNAGKLEMIQPNTSASERVRTYAMTNRGLQIDLELRHIDSHMANILSAKTKNQIGGFGLRRYLRFDEYDFWLSPLNCTLEGERVCLILQSKRAVRQMSGSTQSLSARGFRRLSNFYVTFGSQDFGDVIYSSVYIPQYRIDAPFLLTGECKEVSITFSNFHQHDIYVSLVPGILLPLESSIMDLSNLPQSPPETPLVFPFEGHFSSYGTQNIRLSDARGDHLIVMFRSVLGQFRLEVAVRPGVDASVPSSSSSRNAGMDSPGDDEPVAEKGLTGWKVISQISNMTFFDRVWVVFPRSKKVISVKIAGRLKDVLMNDVQIEAHGEGWEPALY